MGYIQTEKDDGLVTAWITALSSGVTPQSVALIDNIAEDVEEKFRFEAPVLWSDLMNGTTIDVISPLGRLIYSNAPHFPFVVLGTKPHSIGSAINIKGVGWRYIGLSPLTGGTYLGKSVGREGGGKGTIHPGTPPNDFPARAFDNAQGQIDNRIEEYLNWFENP
jgi:hypothetical protein